MADELIDIVDKNNNLTGEQKMKSEAHAKGLWHRATHVLFYNSNGEILIQLRAKNKELHPNMWDISVGGHIQAGEEVEASTIREINEELGIIVGEKDLYLAGVRKKQSLYQDIINNEFCYIYFYKFDGSRGDLEFADGEVQAIRFVQIDQLEKELKEDYDKFVPHGDYWDYIIDTVRQLLKE